MRRADASSRFRLRNKQIKLVPGWEPKVIFGTGALLPTDQQSILAAPALFWHLALP